MNSSPTHKATLPTAQGALCKAGLWGGSDQRAYLHQQSPAAIPVHLQVFPVAEAHRGHHGVLDAEVT